MDFELCEGVAVEGAQGVRSSFAESPGELWGTMSAGLMRPAAEGFIDAVPEPLFFFLELCGENDGETKVYYLDNITRPVARAVLDRFGELLVNDGASRFGFGSHKTGEELFFKDFQEFSLYSERPGPLKTLLKKIGLAELPEPDSLYSLMSDEAPGSLSAVEIEGETVFDIPEALKNAGMYEFKD